MKLVNKQTVNAVRVAPVSMQANARSDVKRSGRSQNCSLQKGLPV